MYRERDILQTIIYSAGMIINKGILQEELVTKDFLFLQ